MKKIISSARVVLTIEVSRCGTWGQDCKMDQVYKQAAESAIGYIKDRCDKDRRITLIGDPKVITVMAEDE